MLELTPERLQELRRFVEAATTGPEEIITPSHPVFDATTVRVLPDGIEQLEAGNNNRDSETYGLYRRIERLEAKLARQRVALRRLQVAVERRNSQERIEALRRKLSGEKRLMDRIEALEAMLLRLYQDVVIPSTGYCTRCCMIGGHD